MVSINNEFIAKRHLDGYRRCVDFFDDDLSKTVVSDKVNWLLYNHKMTFQPEADKYFENELITLMSNEIFVDGGAFDGDTVLEFIKRSGGEYKAVYSFEPDTKNFLKAQSNLKSHKAVTVINKGLWHSTTNLAFCANANRASRIGECGESFIGVTSLDDYFAKKQYPTFIKMDIEGAEQEALRGAKKIISAVKPKLAICAYHKIEDFYVLPEIIREINPCYKFYLRHYSEHYKETVLYAL